MDKKAESERLKTFWQAQLADWSASGKSQAAYCQEMNLNRHQFGYWKRKLLGKSNARQKQSRFVAVKQDHTESGLSLTLPNGLIIRGIHQNNLAVVDQLLRQL